MHPLASYLRSLDAPVFALLDAARDPAVLATLGASDAPRRSLYEGAQGDQLAAWAPYLVALDPGAALLDALAAKGWGNAWGVYLTSAEPFDAVRRHLRRFLTVQDPGGRSLYFRYYDPRVLRAFLPACAPDEVAALFAAVSSFVVEDADPSRALVFRAGGAAGAALEVVPFAAPLTGRSRSG